MDEPFRLLVPDADGLGNDRLVDLSVASQSGDFGLVFTIMIHAPTAGTYEFYARSDAGSKLFIDDVPVVDTDGLHPPTTVEGSHALTVGDHTLRVEYFAASSGATHEVGYRTGVPVFEPIPANGQLTFMSSNPTSIGSWGAVIPWPEIAILAAVLPDGRILTWSSTEIDAFPETATFTHASVFDPATLEAAIAAHTNFSELPAASPRSSSRGTEMVWCATSRHGESGGRPTRSREGMHWKSRCRSMWMD